MLLFFLSKDVLFLDKSIRNVKNVVIMSKILSFVSIQTLLSLKMQQLTLFAGDI